MQSILYEGEIPGNSFRNTRYMKDLNLDDIIDRLCWGKDEFKLKDVFENRLTDISQITYRQDVFRDLENEGINKELHQFVSDISNLKKNDESAQRCSYVHQRSWYIMHGVSLYIKICEGIAALLSASDIRSKALLAVTDYLNDYINTDSFISMKRYCDAIEDALSKVSYTVHVKGNGLDVIDQAPAEDYGKKITDLFSRFRQSETDSYLYHGFTVSLRLNMAEEKIIDALEKFYPKLFAALDEFALRYGEYMDPGIYQFYGEIQFYLTFLDHIEPMKRKGLKFCYPKFNDQHVISIHNGFNMAVAREVDSVITNDFESRGGEKIFIVTGANQGGKTTFARMCGQILYFAQTGTPVPAESADIYMVSEILTHFEVDEDVHTENGKLKEDLIRVKEILSVADENSFVILNEVFSSTTMADAEQMGARVIKMIESIGASCIYVTFLDRLLKMCPECISLVSGANDDGSRTFKIERRPADGKSYAMYLADKYHLRYSQIKERMVDR